MSIDYEKFEAKYIKRNLVNYEVGDDNKLFINSQRVINFKTTTDLEDVIKANATIINTVICNLLDFVAGRNNPDKHFKKCKAFVEEILNSERQ